MLATQLGQARAATVAYATDLAAAERDGYMIITPMMDGMGYHYLNPEITEFDPARPPILVYAKDGDRANLVALEWVWPEQPATPPMEGATYGAFGAACHYRDGTFVFVAAEADYPEPFAAAVWYENILATQFHPEKSQRVGLAMLSNFAGL